MLKLAKWITMRLVGVHYTHEEVENIVRQNNAGYDRTISLLIENLRVLDVQPELLNEAIERTNNLAKSLNETDL